MANRKIGAQAATPDMGEDDARPLEQGTLRRGLAVVDALVAAERSLSLAELSAAVSLSPSTTHRILQMLIDSRRVFKTGAGRFCLAPRSIAPLSLYHPVSSLRRDSGSILADLQRTFGPSAALMLMVGSERMVVDISPGDDSFVPYFDTHLTSPLHCSASGKIILSNHDWDEVGQLIGAGPYERRTPRTIIDPVALKLELEATRARGYALNLDENLMGISAIGAGVHLKPGLLAGSVVLTGPSKYFQGDQLSSMTQAVAAAAALFSMASPSLRRVGRYIDIL